VPEMKLLGKYPHESWLGIRLYSIMAHPNDPVLQDQFMAWSVIQHLSNNAKLIEKKSGQKNLNWQLECLDELRIILNAPSYSEVTKRTESNIEVASIIGELVYAIMLFHKTYKTTKVGVNKAAYLIKTMMQKRPKSALRNVSENTVKKYLEVYKSVSHLWAALRLLKNQFGSKEYPNCLALLEKQNALLLLSVSEEMRKVGEKFYWHSNRPPLYQKNICWRPPRNFKLPKLKSLNWPPPSNRQKEILIKKDPKLEQIF